MKCSTENEPTLVYDFEGSRYVNLTNRCSMRCKFCPRTRGDFRIGEYDLKFKRGPKPSLEDYFTLLGDLSDVDEVVFCGYGESTEKFEALKQIALYSKRHGCKVRLNTNGHATFYTRRDIVPELVDIVDSVSVSLNAQNEELYEEHCKPRFKGAYNMMLRFCKQCVAHNIDIQMSAIDGLRGVDIKACEQIALDIGSKFKYRKLNLMINKEKKDV